MDTDQAKLLTTISSFLEKHHIPYMITGAWSAIFYGRPRASHDIDFVIELDNRDLQKIFGVFEKLKDEFLVQPESIKSAISHCSMFNIIHLPTMLKIDFWILTDDEFDQLRFKRRKKADILDHSMEMATPEDTIIQKLKWYRMGQIEKHLVDAAFVYQIQNKNLDKKYLNLWVKKLKLEKYYQKLKKINLEEHL